ncbi:MAG TPA: enoyl-CoA hydratase/isomerase family protein [Anaerolineales bacterium]|nr:enoyl-CoA hydratase/isomerase family protein [Anaerolineales bacterium]
MSDSNPVLTELSGPVLKILLDRPKANAFNLEMIEALRAAFKQAERDEQVRCVLLTGSGKVFSAGQDVKDFMSPGDRSFRAHLQETYNPLVLQIRKLEKPVIAAINGAVAGAALGVALSCDLRIASDDARFVVGFLGIGLGLDSAVSLLLPALIGLGRAAQYAFTNAPISAQDALAWGLVNRLAPAGQLRDEAAAWAAQIAQGPVRAMGLAKRDFNKAVLGNLAQVLDYEAHNQDIAGRGPEHKEGLRAFVEKRSPSYV